VDVIMERAENTLASRSTKYGADTWATVERLILLRSIDQLWVEHLTELDDFRRGVGLRGYGGTDPLVEFKREAFKLYEELRGFIRHGVASTIFRVNVQVQQPAPPPGPASLPMPSPEQLALIRARAATAANQRAAAAAANAAAAAVGAGTPAAATNGTAGNGAADGPTAPADASATASAGVAADAVAASAAATTIAQAPSAVAPGAAAPPVIPGLTGAPRKMTLQKGDEAVGSTTTGTAGTSTPDGKAIGRNDPCFCGSGLKYKKCHGK